MPHLSGEKTAMAEGVERAPARDSRRAIYLAGALIVGAGLAAYANSFSTPFIFDDKTTIVDNPTIQHLWPPWTALSPPGDGSSVTSRPVLNYSFAINHAISGNEAGSYHALNLLIHVLAGLALFGIVRRTLLGAALRERYGAEALMLALAVALLWTVHPLLTESVIVAAQRSESLMGLFYLLTLYAFIRGVDSPRPWRWHGWAIAACLLGMGTKEVMVTAPLIVLLYDRTFVAGSFREAWRRRERLYAGLAATWLLLFWLELGSGGGRGDPEGLNVHPRLWDHVPIQSRAVITYLKLAFWPHPLVLDYGGVLPTQSLGVTLLQIAAVAALVTGTLWALWRRPALGFLGAWFFVILAPSTTIILLMRQVVAEHRMYLPLAAVVTLAVLGIHALAGRRSRLVFMVLAAGLGGLTYVRNADYHDQIALWTKIVSEVPDNARAHLNLGAELFYAHRAPEAEAQFREAVRLEPDYYEAVLNLANMLFSLGRDAEAIEYYRAALKLSPLAVTPYLNLAKSLADTNQLAAAERECRIALALEPSFMDARINLGDVLTDEGRLPEALEVFEQASRLDPAYPMAQYDAANTLLRLGRYAEAKAYYTQAVRLEPDNALAHTGLANALALLGWPARAIPEYEEALRLQPNLEMARVNLAHAQQLAQEAAATGTNAGH